MAAFQFNFVVRRRVRREDGTEYLFDLRTVAVLADGAVGDELAELAQSVYSLDTNIGPDAQGALHALDALDVDQAFESAKNYLENRIELWDWDEDVEPIGVAKVLALPRKN